MVQVIRSVLHRNSDDNDKTRVALSSHGLHWNLYNNHKLTFNSKGRGPETIEKEQVLKQGSQSNCRG